MPVEYIDLDSFSSICGFDKKTIINKHRKNAIPGVIETGGVFRVLKGTRYPFDKRKISKKDRPSKVYTVLKAISEERYISAKDVGLYEEQFKEELNNLMQKGLIQYNNIDNLFGANAFDITEKGSNLLLLKRSESLREIVLLSSEAAGHFAGKMYATVAESGSVH